MTNLKERRSSTTIAVEGLKHKRVVDMLVRRGKSKEDAEKIIKKFRDEDYTYEEIFKIFNSSLLNRALRRICGVLCCCCRKGHRK
jgi:hypothetical protein